MQKIVDVIPVLEVEAAISASSVDDARAVEEIGVLVDEDARAGERQPSGRQRHCP